MNKLNLNIYVLFAFFVILGCQEKNAPLFLKYTITPMPLEDRMDLKINLSFITNKDSIRIGLPTDYYGTPNIHRYVKNLSILKEGRILQTPDSLQKIVIPNKNNEVFLEYILSYKPDEINTYSFAPVISKNYFSVAGCQWLLHVDNDTTKSHYNIKFKDIPKNWQSHTSIGKDINNLNTLTNYNQLISSRIGSGGDYYTFKIKNKPVNVYIKGKFDISNDSIFSNVEKIVSIQRDWFNDYDQSFYHIVINERDDIAAGTAFNNQFVCFFSPTVSLQKLNITLAHEMFHNWLPTKIEIIRQQGNKLTTDDYNEKFEWFSEGFTTYFAKRILFDANLISKEVFVDLINKEIQQLADSELKNITQAELDHISKMKNTLFEHKNLAYWRGALIALKWEKELEEKGETLSNYIRELYAFSKSKNGRITEDDFFSFSANFGVNAKNDYKKFIIEGNTITLPDEPIQVLKNEFQIVDVEFKSFQPGFNFIASKIHGKIVGLTLNSNAYNAGLRNNMTYIKAKNWYRGKNGWSEERPMQIITKTDGVEKEIAFIPIHTNTMIQKIIKR